MSGPDRGKPLESELLRQRIRLYLYGELSLAERHEVEVCREEDPAFAALFEDEEAFLLTLGGRELDHAVGPLLQECRGSLERAVAREERQRRESSVTTRLWSTVCHGLRVLAARRLVWQPALACGLLAGGFLLGRGSHPASFAALGWGPLSGSGEAISFSSERGPTLTGIQTVLHDPAADQVQIVLEERRVVRGQASDPLIRGMLLETVRESHAGARLSSLEALRRHASDREVRRTLLHSMLEDENPGVRFKALEAVGEHGSEPEVRQALLKILRHDPNAGMRVQAIQLLGEHPGRDLAGALQDIVTREPNPYVLQQSEQILHALGASLEHY